MKDSDLLSYYGIIGIFMQYLENSEHINLIKRLSLGPSNNGDEAADMSTIENVCSTEMLFFCIPIPNA